MKKLILTLIIIAGVATVLVAVRFSPRTPLQNPRPFPEKPDLLKVTNLRANDVVKSPLNIAGEARGYWYFEASFPVKLFDADGNNIPLNPPYIMATSDWMTENFVPFEATLEFAPSGTATGTLVLEKDNPSGLPEHADSLSIPVRFW